MSFSVCWSIGITTVSMNIKQKILKIKRTELKNQISDLPINVNSLISQLFRGCLDPSQRCLAKIAEDLDTFGQISWGLWGQGLRLYGNNYGGKIGCLNDNSGLSGEAQLRLESAVVAWVAWLRPSCLLQARLAWYFKCQARSRLLWMVTTSPVCRAETCYVSGVLLASFPSFRGTLMAFRASSDASNRCFGCWYAQKTLHLFVFCIHVLICPQTTFIAHNINLLIGEPSRNIFLDIASVSEGIKMNSFCLIPKIPVSRILYNLHTSDQDWSCNSINKGFKYLLCCLQNFSGPLGYSILGCKIINKFLIFYFAGTCQNGRKFIGNPLPKNQTMFSIALFYDFITFKLMDYRYLWNSHITVQSRPYDVLIKTVI
ncbi:hypothetical protein VP01_1162g4 [Puccinia sorghi]|uniref:Uncharacterized protein n=1 Tax=Puccinia sorghi TaxID=27349 RepID=A0A0L6VSX0_9BASI|nr:hypothetical protein VP01_1162g4 [Puccinia sorghi]